MFIFYLLLISSTFVSSSVICWIYFHQRNTFYWQLEMSVVPPLLSRSQFLVRYIPSAMECPLLLQLPDGQISKTNSFISPVSYHAIIIILISFFLRLLKLKVSDVAQFLLVGILQMWGGVIVLNPQTCRKDSESKHPSRHTLLHEVRCFSITLSACSSFDTELLIFKVGSA